MSNTARDPKPIGGTNPDGTNQTGDTGGDYVMPTNWVTGAYYTPAQLLGGGRSVTLYVEGVDIPTSGSPASITVGIAQITPRTGTGVELPADESTVPENYSLSDTVVVGIIRVDITAYRPTTEGPAYNTPFQRRAIPENQEENPGAGIRVNGDDDNSNNNPDRNDSTVNNENDLIEVELKAEPYPATTGLSCILKRSNTNIKVWDSQTKGTAILDSGTEVTITFNTATKTVWVENPNGGSADLELIARSGNTDICSDKIHFYPFTSIVIVLGGETQNPSDPADANHGIFQSGIRLYEQGYDVHMYDEDDVDYGGAGTTYNEVVNAIKYRNVNQVAIYGYSHGGGSTYLLANLLNNNRGIIGTFTIPFTAYVDAVEDEFFGDANQEHRRPPTSGFHVNYYQEGVTWPPWDANFDGGLDGGPINNPPGADFELDVDSPTPTETHMTVDDDATVLNGVETRLTPRVNR